MSSPLLRRRLESEALRLWLQGRSYFDIVDELIELATMATADELGIAVVSSEAQLEDWETEGRRHAARINED